MRPRDKTRTVIEPDQYSVDAQKSKMSPENLKCPACSKIFSGKVYVLHCGHSVCLECINIQISSDNQQYFHGKYREYYYALLYCPRCDQEMKVYTRYVYTLTRSGRCMKDDLLMARGPFDGHGYFPHNRIVETMAQEYK